MPSSFSSSNLYCELELNFSLNSTECNYYVDLSIYNQFRNSQLFAVSRPFSITGYIIAYNTTINGNYISTLTAKYSNYGSVVSTSIVNCLNPVQLTQDNSYIYYQETYFNTSQVYENGIVVGISSIGSGCQYSPIIDNLRSQNNRCTSSGLGLVCSVYYPVSIIITVSGSNFGNLLPTVYIGDLQANVINYTNTSINCYLPLPNFASYTNVIVYVMNNDNKNYSMGYQLISYTYPFTIEISAVDYYYVMEDNGYFNVLFNGNFILPMFTCKLNNSTSGTFNYTGVLSSCIFTALEADQVYSLSVCFLATCSNTISFKVFNNIQITTNITSGHNHGGYLISLSVSYSGNCVEGNTYLRLGSFTFKPNQSCNNNSPNTYSFYIQPQSSCNSESVAWKISLNAGITFVDGNQSFSFTGCCSNGTFINQSLCSLCPLGYYCNLTMSTSAVLITPIPCDLGTYSNETGSTSCSLCPLGHQCYCRRTIDPNLCDAGYICSDLGTTKRRNPCPKGRYCLPGSFYTTSNNSDV